MFSCNHAILLSKINRYNHDNHDFIHSLVNYFNASQFVEANDCWDNGDNANCPINIYTTYLIY